VIPLELKQTIGTLFGRAVATGFFGVITQAKKYILRERLLRAIRPGLVWQFCDSATVRFRHSAGTPGTACLDQPWASAAADLARRIG
jgi:hypothetical protein